MNRTSAPGHTEKLDTKAAQAGSIRVIARGWPARAIALFALAAAIVLALALNASASVGLTYFRATSQADGSILVNWETATETNSAAFRVYRAESHSGPWDSNSMVNQQAAAGGVTGASYHFVDSGVTPGTTYYYLLKEVETNNSVNTYDTLIASATAGTSGGPTPTSTLTPTNGPSPTATATPTRTPVPSSTRAATRTPSDAPTATRQFTNTPPPEPTATPGLPGAVTAPTSAPVLTETVAPESLGPAQVSTPTGVAPVAPIPAAVQPTQQVAVVVPTRFVAATLAPSLTPLAAETSELSPATPAFTATPAIFGPKETSQPLLRTTARAQPVQASTAEQETARNTRLILGLGGGAVVLAAALGFGAVLISRRGRR